MRLSAEAKRLVVLLAQKLSISQAAVFELAVRDYAKREGIAASGTDVAFNTGLQKAAAL